MSNSRNHNSSNILLKIDNEGRLTYYKYSKLSCGNDISNKTDLHDLFYNKTLEDIVDRPFTAISDELKITAKDQEYQFIIFQEWDALRTSIAKYLGTEDDKIDTERCIIESVNYNENEIEINEIVLPPKDLPKI